MEPSYLIDSNVLIDYISEQLPTKSLKHLDKLFDNNCYISKINRIEILGYSKYTPSSLKNISALLSNFTELNLSEEIAISTINVRKTKRIKLPDAIIVGTALVNELILITRNTSDFKNIKGLKTINPYEL